MHEFYAKTTNYWQAVLRVGLPFVVLYRGADYLIFRIMKDSRARFHYLPWQAAVVIDVVTVLILSTLWWSVMRSVFGKGGCPDNRSRDDYSKN
jgi:hypothetical protein